MQLTLFPDTNFFLELPAASGLPWQQLASPGQAVEHVRLVLPRPVVGEIEHHKRKGNSRAASRAREVSALIRKARHGAIELKPEKPRVTFEISPLVALNFQAFPFLDPSKTDHEIIAQYAAIRENEPGLAIISDDTLMIMAAEQCGFAPIEVPETWRLPAEKDDRDKKIDSLQRKLLALKRSAPALRVAMYDEHGDAKDALNLIVKTYARDGDRTRELAEIIAAEFPKEPFSVEPEGARRIANPILVWKSPSEIDYAQYANNDHPNWAHGLTENLERVAQAASLRSHRVKIRFSLENSGFANAINVRFTISAFDGFRLIRPEKIPEGAPRRQIHLPAPPAVPKGKYVNVLEMSDRYGHLLNPLKMAPQLSLSAIRARNERDPHNFYYSGETDLEPVLVLDCAAFPHQGEPHRFAFDLIVPVDEPKARSRLEVFVQASNLPNPIKATIPVHLTPMTYTASDWFESHKDDPFGTRA